MPIDYLQRVEQSAPAHRCETLARDIASCINDHRANLTRYERSKLEAAISDIHYALGSIRTRLTAKTGEIGRAPISIIHED
ncbi:MAG: hypothetical protein P4M15_07285 [Alphaproteobacteria bacterium]|nr:hypothetical protein [Alphaproteobacteria bacterium]